MSALCLFILFIFAVVFVSVCYYFFATLKEHVQTQKIDETDRPYYGNLTV